MILATCATISAILSGASGGETIKLNGNCAPVTISRKYKTRVVIDAADSTVSGVRITGGNVTWRGGTVRASGGLYGVAVNGYGFSLSGASDVTIENALITGSKKGIAMGTSSRIVIANNVFSGNSDDGIIASASSQVNIFSNTFKNTKPSVMTCTFTNGVVSGMKQVDCAQRGGKWADGYHPDAVQLRDAMQFVLVAYNTVTGLTQGITQMDTTGDRPLQNIFIRNNTVAVEMPHSITLYTNCINCSITQNVVKRGQGSIYKAVVRPGAATACGNVIQDSKLGANPC